MRSTLVVLIGLALVTTGYAKEPKPFQTGKLLQMDSTQCGMSEKEGKSFAGEIIGTDSGSKKTHEVLCQEYLLQTDKVIYRIRPRDEKHPALLPVGEKAQFRIEKDRMVLHVEDLDNKDREYVVISMTPRSSGDSVSASSPSHPQ